MKACNVQVWRRAYWQQWLRVAKSDGNMATLQPRQIYILPTVWGVLYAVMLILLLVGSINYSLSLGYFVTFLLASLGHTAMLHTWRNVVHLHISVLHAKPVFAGDCAQVTIHMLDTKNRARYAIAAKIEQNAEVSEPIAANQSGLFLLPFTTTKRGFCALPRITVYSEFPLSLLHAWAYAELSLPILVYPKPSGHQPLPALLIDARNSGNSRASRGDDDFDGHKNYQLGDAASRVDWKASSRGSGLYTKLYSGEGASDLWLDFALVNGELEARISQLALWVVDAHASQQRYGLKLPNLTLAPSDSQAHYHACMQALALL
ncbi:MAG: DUF58 domain-containing protein [Bdellovibrio sp.]|nr:DUF58 domain-containing protein [Methylotenera sp.]